ncbi:MAG TPA: membrane protein insertion efficiency factor YidD [Candidatus Omnitrophica bacterium]|nr:membrane protein insertion efficiency factor YidD [Candidatus Omnitrophota bacterium]HBH96187.1 membrane protein insertion efficiency factor YidD [Candidatus Omnitrophota bacterium]HBQ38020.1 membrane protein insertion efficiency factor YidD [Candidatus Omnitrophota bacterium]
MNALVLFMIRTYRNYLSLMILPACRFIPPCSAYAEESVRRYGTIRGCWNTLKRLLRCHPLSQGGVDQA